MIEPTSVDVHRPRAIFAVTHTKKHLQPSCSFIIDIRRNSIEFGATNMGPVIPRQAHGLISCSTYTIQINALAMPNKKATNNF